MRLGLIKKNKQKMGIGLHVRFKQDRGTTPSPHPFTHTIEFFNIQSCIVSIININLNNFFS